MGDNFSEFFITPLGVMKQKGVMKSICSNFIVKINLTAVVCVPTNDLQGN